MKKYLTTGIITLLPIVLTIWIVRYLFDLFTTPLFNIVESFIMDYEKSHGLNLMNHDTLVLFLSRVIALILTLVLIFVLGFFGRRYFFHTLINFGNDLVMRVPIVGTIYRLTKDITKVVFSADQKTFKQTVLIPFPSSETHSLGLVTGGVPEKLKKSIQDAQITVFVPTAPYPVSGYILLASKKGVVDVDMSVEETFKFLVTCGVVTPPTPNAP